MGFRDPPAGLPSAAITEVSEPGAVLVLGSKLTSPACVLLYSPSLSTAFALHFRFSSGRVSKVERAELDPLWLMNVLSTQCDFWLYLACPKT